MSNGIKVRKRDGSVEPLNLDKVHKPIFDPLVARSMACNFGY